MFPILREEGGGKKKKIPGNAITGMPSVIADYPLKARSRKRKERRKRGKVQKRRKG